MALSACAGGEERFPTSEDFPATTMSRVSFQAGGGHPWALSALRTPRSAPWKVVIVTGTPSWSEYWAPTLAALPERYTMIVADRPGFSLSEPKQAVGLINEQADALSAMLEVEPGQKVILVGQSYGAPIASLIAARNPDKVEALILMSAFFGERGSTASNLMGLGGMVRPLLPRDLKNSVSEVNGQLRQLPAAREALASLTIPVIVLHGDRDTFVPPAAARRLAEEGRKGGPTLFINVEGGDHFLNACCVPALTRALDAAVEMVAEAKSVTAP
ncbi:MAG: alpha/beta hydrolase [Alphaproteobacteria bacterium]|nr:alpha/beta hydrolase [Alphaproteobacteria bacterium]